MNPARNSGATRARKAASRQTALDVSQRARRVRGPWLPLAAFVVAAGLAAGAVLWVVDPVEDHPEGTSIDHVHIHVHGLDINPADGSIYIATHNGVYELPTGAPARRVGRAEQDTMGFTVAGPDRFLASGHPGRGQSGSPHLGLIESVDGGTTWKSRSLTGQADFHTLRYRHSTAYGYDTVSGEVAVSRDLTRWETRSAISLYDFAVSPSDPDVLLATTERGVERSTDGGRSWAATGGPALTFLDWRDDDTLWGVARTGDVLRSLDGGGTWSRSGTISGTVTAFVATGPELYAAVDARGVFRSGDGGVTWTQRHL